MSAGFTLGPWLVHARHRWIVPAADAFKDAADALPVCQLRDPDERLTEDETLANGFLIAAAPELYEAAQAALSLLVSARRSSDEGKGPTHAEAALKLALAKARGEQ